MFEADTSNPDVFVLEEEAEEEGWVDGEPTEDDLEEEDEVAPAEENEEEASY